jgi:hypothetical protein
MPGQEYALLIGNATFPHDTKLTPLRCPLRDVDGLSAVLSSPTHGPYTVTTLKDQPCDVVRREAYRVLTGAGPDDIVLLYYSGHGKVDEGGLYLTTENTRLDLLPATSVHVSEIKGFINRSRCRRIVLILDCCFSGAVEGLFRGDVSGQVEQILPKDLSGRGTYILTASSDIELAEEREGDEYGLLTKHIILGITDGAADRDDDGLISMRELLNYVQDEVKKEGRQTPRGYALGTEDGDMKLVKTGRAPRDQRRREVQQAIHRMALHAYLPASIVRPAIAILDPVWAQSAGALAVDEAIDRLHRVCRSEPDFMEALFQLPAWFANVERPLHSDLDQARRRCAELETELNALRLRIAHLEAGKSQEIAAAAAEIDRLTTAHNRVVSDFQMESRARVQAESQLSAATSRVRELTDKVEGLSATLRERDRRLSAAPAATPAPQTSTPIPRPLGSIAAEMRRQKELDDARRLGIIAAQPADLERIKAEMAEQKKRDDERRARGRAKGV